MLDRRTVLSLGLGLLATLPGFPAAANDMPFPTWLQGVRAEALKLGIKPGTLDKALAGVQPLARVIELDRKQPEGTMTFAQYMERVVTAQRVDTARQRFDENRPLLEEVSRRFGVQPHFIVALWGIESDFGRIQGTFSVVQALATLGYDGRRSSFFRQELMNALKILDQGHISPEEMKGSWAGAMGQSQFMPSSFLSFAVDFDGDGKRDIWNNRADVLASIANYLSRSGWKGDQSWGDEVLLPARFDGALVGIDIRKPVPEWQSLGIRRPDGRDLPSRDTPPSIVQPGGAEGPALMVSDNYRVIMRWNRSLYFATAVSYLADRIERR